MAFAIKTIEYSLSQGCFGGFSLLIINRLVFGSP